MAYVSRLDVLCGGGDVSHVFAFREIVIDVVRVDAFRGTLGRQLVRELVKIARYVSPRLLMRWRHVILVEIPIKLGSS